MEEQLAVPHDNNLNNSNVAAIDTGNLWRIQEDSPSDQVYHWNLNAETCFRMENSMAKEIIKML